MPVQVFKRGKYYHAKGRVEYNGRPITGTYRRSIKASTEAGAWDWIARERELQIRRDLVFEEVTSTFSDAVMMYNASAKTAKRLIPIVKEIGSQSLNTITGALLQRPGRKLQPLVSTDTWWREIVTPARAVINNAHELNVTPLIRVKAYDRFQRIIHDKVRGKISRVEWIPADKNLIEAFCSAADPYNAALVRFMFETAARIA